MVGEDGLAQGSTAGDTRRHRLRQGAARRRGRSCCTPTAPGARSARTGSTGSASGTRRSSASGTSEDVALLLADVRGASLIIAVGTHATLDEFLDRQRSGLASTFLTRLRVGPKLVDAKGVPQLYAGRVRLWHLLLVLLAGLLALVVAIAATPGGRRLVVVDRRRSAPTYSTWIQGLFT